MIRYHPSRKIRVEKSTGRRKTNEERGEMNRNDGNKISRYPLCNNGWKKRKTQEDEWMNEWRTTIRGSVETL